MIAYIKGILAEVDASSVIVETAGGVAYEIAVMSSDMEMLPELFAEVKLYTYYQVREDGVALYGFLSKSALNLFKQLITVSGVGPKLAHGILSAVPEQELRIGIVTGNVAALSRAPGIGKKTAERLILDLKDKLSIDDLCGEPQVTSAGNARKEESEQHRTLRENAIQILMALGYKQKESLAAIQKVTIEEGMTEEDLVRISLREIG